MKTKIIGVLLLLALLLICFFVAVDKFTDKDQKDERTDDTKTVVTSEDIEASRSDVQSVPTEFEVDGIKFSKSSLDIRGATKEGQIVFEVICVKSKKPFLVYEKEKNIWANAAEDGLYYKVQGEKTKWAFASDIGFMGDVEIKGTLRAKIVEATEKVKTPVIEGTNKDGNVIISKIKSDYIETKVLKVTEKAELPANTTIGDKRIRILDSGRSNNNSGNKNNNNLPQNQNSVTVPTPTPTPLQFPTPAPVQVPVQVTPTPIPVVIPTPTPVAVPTPTTSNVAEIVLADQVKGASEIFAKVSFSGTPSGVVSFTIEGNSNVNVFSTQLPNNIYHIKMVAVEGTSGDFSLIVKVNGSEVSRKRVSY
ncbi:MAG: hypothetical protein N2749_03195 [Clostridia bacterium]|nr:hypothetical protein [Clostridia bacterium]